MGILVHVKPHPAQPFIDALRNEAPDERIWTSDDDAPPESVEAILAFALRPCIAPRYPNLRVVCAIGAGVDRLLAAGDIPAAVSVTRVVDDLQTAQVAQYAVACIVRYTRDFPLYAAQQGASIWKRHAVRPMSACRVGILGMGKIGCKIADVCHRLGYPVAGWNRSLRSHAGVPVFSQVEHGSQSLTLLLSRSDVLVCTLPLTAQTAGMLNHEVLALLPRGAYLINVGRGEQLVESDLKDLLDQGHLAGAALDVFEREPIPAGNWVWSHPKIELTPHIAAPATHEVVARQCLDALRQSRQGQVLQYAVDRNLGY